LTGLLAPASINCPVKSSIEQLTTLVSQARISPSWPSADWMAHSFAALPAGLRFAINCPYEFQSATSA